MLLSGKSAKNGGGLLGGESDEDDVEHLDYVRLCCLFSIRLYSAFRMMKIAGYWRFFLESPTISIRFGACGY